MDQTSLKREYDNALESAMSVSPETQQEALFWSFVYLRNAAWHRKSVLKTPGPWTADPILGTFRFTNMHRELDRGTMYMVVEVAEKCADKYDAARCIAFYRAFNRIDTWVRLKAWVRSKMEDAPLTDAEVHNIIAVAMSSPDGVLCDMLYDFFKVGQSRGDKMFTGAYMMTSMAKVFHEKRLDELALAAIHAIQADDLKEATDTLAGVRGLGQFSAFQVAMDMAIPTLANEGRPWARYDNLDSWVAIGPGSKAGAKIIRPDLPADVCVRYLRQQVEANPVNPDVMPKINGVTMPFRSTDIEHALCEYSKWSRAMSGGRMKSLLTTPTVGASWVTEFIAPPAWGTQS